MTGGGHQPDACVPVDEGRPARRGAISPHGFELGAAVLAAATGVLVVFSRLPVGPAVSFLPPCWLWSRAST